MTPAYVFVYGTLKRGYNNYPILGNSEYIGEAELHGTYAMFSGDFPWLVPWEDDINAGHPLGEVYLVTEENVMQALDRLEGVPYMYTRERDIATITSSLNLQFVDVNVYVASVSSQDRLRESNRETIKPNADGQIVWNIS